MLVTPRSARLKYVTRRLRAFLISQMPKKKKDSVGSWFTDLHPYSCAWCRSLALCFNFYLVPCFIAPILKSLVVPVIWLALIGAIYSWITPFFALNRTIFPANEEATLKTKQPIRFQGLFKVTNVIAGKWKTKSNMWQILQPLFPKLLFPPPPLKNGWI